MPMRPNARGQEALIALELLADKKVVRILRALAHGPLAPRTIETELLDCAHATLIDRLGLLVQQGVLGRQPVTGLPYGVMYGLTDAGEGLLRISAALSTWAATEEDDDGDAARARTRAVALADGWRSAIVPALATGALTRDELCARAGLTHHQVTQRVDRLLRSGLLGPTTRGKPMSFALTQRARDATDIVLLAVFWQRSSPTVQAPPLAPSRVTEALAVSLHALRLPAAPDGVCTLTVQDDRDGAGSAAGLCVTVARREVVSCVSAPGSRPTAWARGTMAAWERTLFGSSSCGIGLGGDEPLIAAVVQGLAATFRPEGVDEA